MKSITAIILTIIFLVGCEKVKTTVGVNMSFAQNEPTQGLDMPELEDDISELFGSVEDGDNQNTQTQVA